MLKEIANLKIPLEDKELEIIKARLDLSYCQLAEDNKRWYLDQIMLRAAALCGSKLPATEFFADIISDELDIFLLKYVKGQLSFQEILLALRFNSRGGFRNIEGLEIDNVPFSGNSFNIEYFAKIIACYMGLRNQMDRKLQNFIDGY